MLQTYLDSCNNPDVRIYKINTKYESCSTNRSEGLSKLNKKVTEFLVYLQREDWLTPLS